LVLGLSFFAGGLGRRSQKFHRTAATNTAAMLFLAVVALVMPAVFDLSLYGSLAPRPPAIDRLSLWSALVLIGAYGGSLIYAFTAQRDLFRPDNVIPGKTNLSPGAATGVLAVGPRYRDRGRGRRKQLGRRAAADGDLSHPGGCVLFRPRLKKAPPRWTRRTGGHSGSMESPCPRCPPWWRAQSRRPRLQSSFRSMR